jgi:TolB protein
LKYRAFIASLFSLIIAAPSFAQIAIQIDRGYDNPKKIAVVPFGRGPNVPTNEEIADIVSFDLARSGQFAPIDKRNMLSQPTRQDQVFYRDWKVLGADYLAIGNAVMLSTGQVEVTYTLYDVVSQRAMTSQKHTASPAGMRDIAHRISDSIYETITGIRGAFSTQIVYVLARNVGTKNAQFRLEMADVDGARARTLVESKEPILSASWSPDGKRVAYVSFEKQKPAIFIQELATGARTMLTDFPGLNSAPAFSPDGRKLAVVLSKDGNPEIYLMDIATRALTRLTRHPSIDTEPSFSPDGQSLLFTSERGGQPQIYRMNIASGFTERITFQGNYNARPRLLPDGKNLVFVHREQGATVFHIALLDMTRDRLLVLTETSLDESPSVAPNGTMLIYATQDRGRGILAAVSIDGRVKYRLPSSAGDVREPAWSPYLTPAIGTASGSSR